LLRSEFHPINPPAEEEVLLALGVGLEEFEAAMCEIKDVLDCPLTEEGADRLR